mmetsp:Transcript_76548/g.219617  ORF Transcript_76548/g.219617 Transcript_76548/m.219617 type:complete len:477 (-) Transcript_76548:974-2404(-)|eukprot:CAMPEP_0119474598 /NCGR_PEP_ID=MMETSP1344-20130328/5789_1 /TAXON_ID=236787 /ORGANISM="Florenciella parvula, Strain CCMP2471" /LENGTH=476 /DNA_ID=CAMNT_0007507925 /DNA_START=172 /DNA_END=1602 /DNA_ORIENTATION=+
MGNAPSSTPAENIGDAASSASTSDVTTSTPTSDGAGVTPAPTTTGGGGTADATTADATAADATNAHDTTPALGTQPHPDELDLVFIVDCTGSMGSYIHAAQTNIRRIMEKIVAFEKTNARFGLVAYRDHPPQDRTYVTRTFDFTSSRKTMQSNVDWMSAAGGGDGPEAVTAGLKAAIDMDWRKEATKVVILIADAPPHGLGERGDGFPNGDPDGHDPLDLARTMLRRGITCYPVGCEPALGHYSFARDFMCTLARITEGQAVTLSSAELLADVIIGGAQEEVALEKIMDEITNEVEEEQTAAQMRGEALDEAELCTRVTQKLASRGTRTRQMKHDSKMESPHADLMTGQATLGAWRKAAPATAEGPDLAGSLHCLDDDCGGEALDLCAASSFSSAPPSRRRSMSPKKKKKASRAGLFSSAPPPMSSAPPPMMKSAGGAAMKQGATSMGATSVTVEEDLISPEQVMRCMKKSAARRR